MKSKIALITSFIIGVSGSVSAQPGYYYGTGPGTDTRQAQMPDPGRILEQGLQRLIMFLSHKNRPADAQIAAFLDGEIAPYFDFNYMARWAGGRLWQAMTPQQRNEFEGELQQMFLGTLASRLSGYSGQQVRVMRPRAGRTNEVTVDVAVLNEGGYPSRLKFRFYASSEGWKIFDVAANGSSAVMHYRKMFHSRMRKRGNSSGNRWRSRY
ncbi:MAG: ABC transporter substrate-binding protein [Gammaproteobacteria bacterium]|nr:ABC transporter substrate-binding protein [Gammaproteobacteria bacterium]